MTSNLRSASVDPTTAHLSMRLMCTQAIRMPSSCLIPQSLQGALTTNPHRWSEAVRTPSS